MTTQEDASDRRIQAAIAELEALIRSQYTTVAFAIGEGSDDPDGVYLTATVDVDDPDEVMDLIVDRLLEIEIDEGLPIYVVPVRTPERIAAMLARRVTEPLPDVSYLRPAVG